MMRGSQLLRAARRPSASDVATRERLLDVATELFAEHGFKRVTVRQISQAARANVAAVNYHFGDKRGLYRAIVAGAIAAMQDTNRAAVEAGQGGSPADQLRAFVRTWLERVTASPKHLWIHRLMTRELEDPTDALDEIFEEVLEPRHEYLSRIVSALTDIPARDPRVMRAIASVLGQCLVFARPLPPRAPAPWRHVAKDIGAAATHIAEFSLAGLRAMKDNTGS